MFLPKFMTFELRQTKKNKIAISKNLISIPGGIFFVKIQSIYLCKKQVSE
jgi:hypothetical protein